MRAVTHIRCNFLMVGVVANPSVENPTLWAWLHPTSCTTNISPQIFQQTNFQGSKFHTKLQISHSKSTKMQYFFQITNMQWPNRWNNMFMRSSFRKRNWNLIPKRFGNRIIARKKLVMANNTNQSSNNLIQTKETRNASVDKDTRNLNQI